MEEKAATVYARLLNGYGVPMWNKLPPVDELINTIISQNTNDRNRDIAFGQLRERFSSWEAVRDAPENEVLECIRCAGLGIQKAPRIQEALRRITEQNDGVIGLTFLEGKPPEEIRKWLTSLNGVGMKTASIVMTFSLGIPAFPVDTHIYRVSGRLGLRPEKMTVDQTHDHLSRLFPPETYNTAHINLILFGRRVCHAQKPACEVCFLKDLCVWIKSKR